MNGYDEELWEATMFGHDAAAIYRREMIRKEQAAYRANLATKWVKYINHEMTHNTDAYDLFELEDLLS